MKRIFPGVALLLSLGSGLGSEGIGPVAPALSDPNATRETVALYRNLHQLAPDTVLLGHQDTLAYGVGWKAGEADFDSDVRRVCGKFPAVFGWDIGHIGDTANIDGVPFEQMKKWILRGYSRGGVNTISWHARVPGSKESSWTRKEIVKQLLPGGDLHDVYLSKLEEVAGFIDALRAASGERVPVIFRPFHEHTGDWFWWGARWCTPEEYRQIWHFTADYLRKTRGLHNLILCYSPDRFRDREQYLERYPGDDYVDILGHDNYGDLRSPTTRNQIVQALQTVVALAEERDKLAALTETGVRNAARENVSWWTGVLLEAIKASPATRRVSWVLVWRNADQRQNFGPFPDGASSEDFRAFERDPFTRFLEDLPGLYE